MADTHITSGIVTIGSGLSAVASGVSVITSVSGNTVNVNGVNISGNIIQTSVSGNIISTSVSGNIIQTSVSGNNVVINNGALVQTSISGNSVVVDGVSVSGNAVSVSGNVVICVPAPVSDPIVICGQTIVTFLSGGTQLPDIPARSGIVFSNINPSSLQLYVGGQGSNAPYWIDNSSDEKGYPYTVPSPIIPVTNANQLNVVVAHSGTVTLTYLAFT